MRLQLLVGAILGSSPVIAHHLGLRQAQALEARRAQATNAAEFSSAAAQLISLYIPASVSSAILSAASSASVTGDPASIVQSALTAISNPAWFSAIPTQYSGNIQSLDSAISDLRGAASTGIPGADRVMTSTTVNGAGATLVATRTIPGTTITPATRSSGINTSTINPAANSAAWASAFSAALSAESASVTGAAASASSKASGASASASSAINSAKSSASAAESSASVVASSASAAATSSSGSGSGSSSCTANCSAAGASSTSSGFAAPTRVPVAAALGLLGLAVAL